MCKRLSGVAVLALLAAALSTPQAALAGAAHQKPQPAKILWGE